VNGECSHTIRKITVDDQRDGHGQHEKIKGVQSRMIDYDLLQQASSSLRKRSWPSLFEQLRTTIGDRRRGT
jgi:hypothetical protein